VIEKINVEQGTTVEFTAADVFTTTDSATDASLEANQLLISADYNMLVDKITVFGTVKLTPGSGALTDEPNADIVQNFEGFAHNSGNPVIFAPNNNAVVGVVQADDFAYVTLGNPSKKALLVGQITANTTTSGALPKIQVKLPTGKTLADYAGIQIKYMGLSGNSASKTNVIMVGQNLTAENYSNAIATNANYETKKTIAAGTGVAQSGASYNSYPSFTWNTRAVTFATSTQIQNVIGAAGNSFDMAFGAHATAAGVIYLVDDIILVGKPAAEATETTQAYPGTENFIVADFENSPTITKIGDGVVYSIIDLFPLATYAGKYGKVLFALSNSTGAIPGLQLTLPNKATAVSYKTLSFSYFALTEGADNKALRVKVGATAEAANAAAGVSVDSGSASAFKTLSVNLSPQISSGVIAEPQTSTNIFVGIGPTNGTAGSIYLIDDITLHY
jgi:hypothetical protein